MGHIVSNSISSVAFEVAFLPYPVGHQLESPPSMSLVLKVSSSLRKFLNATVACSVFRLLVSIICQETILSITDTI